MKLPKPLSVLILIVSALLLSAASPSPKPSPFPNPRDTEKQSEGASFDQQQCQQHPNPLILASTAQSPDKRAKARQERDDGLLIAATIVMALATAAMAWFNWQLVGVTRDMTKATQNTAAAARDALHSNRPYLLVMSVTPFGARKHPIYDVEVPISGASIAVRNVGSSPAEIVAIRAGHWTYDYFLPEEPKWDTLIPDNPIDIGEPVLGVGQEMAKPIFIVIPWSEDNIKAVEAGSKRVALYGDISYRSGSKETYYTRFFWWFCPLTQPSLYKAYCSPSAQVGQFGAIEEERV
jgi:hypothetical protein